MKSKSAMPFILMGFALALPVAFLLSNLGGQNPDKRDAWGVVGLFATPIVFSTYGWKKSTEYRQEEIKRATQQYELTKKNLQRNPNDSGCRDRFLFAARDYYSTLRNGPLTIYDEQAITNDLKSIIG